MPDLENDYKLFLNSLDSLSKEEIERLTPFHFNIPEGYTTLQFYEKSVLDVKDERFSYIPCFPNLTELKCDNWELSSFPERLSLDKLVTLDCSNNQLVSLPALPMIVTLNCSNNQLVSLPDLPNVVNLDCRNNRLTRLPDLPMVVTLECINNPMLNLTDFPTVVNLNCKHDSKLETCLGLHNENPVLQSILNRNRLVNFNDYINKSFDEFYNTMHDKECYLHEFYDSYALDHMEVESENTSVQLDKDFFLKNMFTFKNIDYEYNDNEMDVLYFETGFGGEFLKFEVVNLYGSYGDYDCCASLTLTYQVVPEKDNPSMCKRIGRKPW